MPSLGADMEAGTLIEKLVHPGDPVKRGDIIAAVETQKGAIEIEVFEDGVLQEWLVDLGTKVPVGVPLAMIKAEGEAETADLSPEPPKAIVADEDMIVVDYQTPTKPVLPTPAASPRPADRPRVTPAARRLAAQQGIDLATLSTQGTISLSDIAALGTKPKPAPMSDMRAAISAAMSRSKREIPHYYLSHLIDLEAADAFVKTTNADREPQDRLLLGALYAKAVAKALKKYPEFNGNFIDDTFQQSDAVHLGLAINIRNVGLVAPALFDAENQPLDDLMSAMRDLVERVRGGRFRARELSDATITLTSLGDRGVDELFGVIYPPQVAIVGIGTPRQQPIIHNGDVTARLSAMVTLAADHRVSDGHRGALFLKAIDKHLQKPEAL